MKLIDILFLIIVNVIFGSAYAVAGYAMSFFTPIFLYAMRFLSTGLFTIGFNKFPKEDIKKIFILSLFNTFKFVAIALCVKNLSSSITVTFQKLEVIFSVILASIILKEKISAHKIIGIIICFSGVLVIAGNMHFTSIMWTLFIMVSALADAYVGILAKEIKNSNSNQLTAWSTLFMGIELLLCSLCFEKGWVIKTLDVKAILLVIYLGVFASYISYLLLYYLIKKYNVNTIIPYNFSRNVIGIIAGNLILGEPITGRKVIGTILIILGTYIAQNNKLMDKFKKSN